MSRGFSRAMRRQCVILKLIEVIDDLLSAEARRPTKTKACIKRIAARQHEIFQNVTGHAESGEMGYIRQKQLYNAVKPVMNEISKIKSNEIHALDWINAVLCLCENQIDEIPPEHKAKRKAWGMMLKSLITLYTHFDPDLTRAECMKSGAEMAEDFRLVMP